MNLSMLKAKTPEILIGVGVVSVIAGVVTTIVATHKSEKIISEHKEQMSKLGEAIENDTDENGSVENSDEYRHSVSRLYLKTALRIAGYYAVPAALTATGIFCFTKSYSMTKAKLVAMTSAYVTLDTAFKRYRENVISEQGEEADERYLYGYREEEITEITKDEETGEEKQEIRSAKFIDLDHVSPYAIIFDREHSSQYDETLDYNLTFVQQQMLAANDLYFQRGSHNMGISLNDIRGMLGCDQKAIIPSIDATGQIIGFKDHDGVAGLPYEIIIAHAQDQITMEYYPVIVVEWKDDPQLLYSPEDLGLVEFE